MAWGYSLILMVLDMKANGSMTCNMAMVLSYGMEALLNTKVTFGKVKRMEKENFLGRMEVIMKAILLTVSFKASAFITSLIWTKHTRVNLG